jgi:hypothetical protein
MSLSQHNYEDLYLTENVIVTPRYATGNVRMIYGGYEFAPVPIINYAREIVRDEANNKFFNRVTLGCQGALLAQSGQISFGQLDKTKFVALKNALAIDRQLLTITHQSGYFASGVYPRIENFQTGDTNNWVSYLRYSFNFVWEEEFTKDQAVQSFSENWQWQETEDGRVEVSHQIQAKGLNTNRDQSNNALQNARRFVQTKLGPGSIPILFPTQISVIYGKGLNVTYIRRLYQEQANPSDGSYYITENFILVSGHGLNYAHKRNSQISTDQNNYSTLSVTGEIQGQGNTPDERTNNASAAWLSIKSTLYNIATEDYTDLGGSRTLQLTPLSINATTNPGAGKINYTYTFTDRLVDTNATNIISRDLTINRKDPIHIFVSKVIPGRTGGPVVQDIGTTNEGTYQISGKIVGVTLNDAINYANYLIGVYNGDSLGTKSWISDKSYDKDQVTNTVTFNITWMFVGIETTPFLS